MKGRARQNPNLEIQEEEKEACLAKFAMATTGSTRSRCPWHGRARGGAHRARERERERERAREGGRESCKMLNSPTPVTKVFAFVKRQSVGKKGSEMKKGGKQGIVE